jgi:hypothetical protein
MGIKDVGRWFRSIGKKIQDGFHTAGEWLKKNAEPIIKPVVKTVVDVGSEFLPFLRPVKKVWDVADDVIELQKRRPKQRRLDFTSPGKALNTIGEIGKAMDYTRGFIK